MEPYVGIRGWGKLMPRLPSVADKYPLAYSVPAVQCSVTQSTPRAVTLSGCLLVSLRSISNHIIAASTNAPTGSTTGGRVGAAVSCLCYTPRLRRETLARCCSSRQIRRAWAVIYCTVLFAVPDFPGNLAVFIPGKSGMKKSGNLGRPGNGSPGMNSLELNNLNHIEFNHTLMTLFPQSIFL